MSTDLEEKNLARKVRQQSDREAFEKIFREYYQRLCNYAHGFVDSGEVSKDIVHSVFLNIWDQREEWNPESTVSQYLFTAVRNRALNVLRHERIKDDTENEVVRVFRELKDDNQRRTKDQGVEKLREEIQKGIEDLPPRRREIFLLSRRSGLTYREIASVLEISVNTVRTQMGRALKELRDHLKDWLPLAAAVNIAELMF